MKTLVKINFLQIMQIMHLLTALTFRCYATVREICGLLQSTFLFRGVSLWGFAPIVLWTWWRLWKYKHFVCKCKWYWVIMIILKDTIILSLIIFILLCYYVVRFCFRGCYLTRLSYGWHYLSWSFFQYYCCQSLQPHCNECLVAVQSYNEKASCSGVMLTMFLLLP